MPKNQLVSLSKTTGWAKLLKVVQEQGLIQIAPTKPCLHLLYNNSICTILAVNIKGNLCGLYG